MSRGSNPQVGSINLRKCQETGRDGNAVALRESKEMSKNVRNRRGGDAYSSQRLKPSGSVRPRQMPLMSATRPPGFTSRDSAPSSSWR
jgi:hypothetical protein